MPLTLPQNFSDVLDYRHILWKRRWTVLLCTALVLLFTGYRVYKEVPVYYSSARILLSYRPPEALDMEGVFQPNPYSQMRQQQDSGGATLVLLSCRMLAERVIEKLDLVENSSLFRPTGHSMRYYLGSLVPESVRRKVKSLLGISKPAEPEGEIPPEQSEEMKAAIRLYLTSLSVQPTETGLVNVSFSGTDPKQLQKILTTHLQEFVKLDLEVKFETSEEASSWIKEKLEEAKHRLEASELALLKYADENGIPPNPEQVRPLASELGELQGSIAQNTQLLRNREAAVQQLKQVLQNPDMIYSFPSVRDESPMLDNYKADLARLTAEYENKSIEFGPDHPKMIQLRKQIENMKHQIKSEARKLYEAMEIQVAFFGGMLKKAEEKKVETEKNMLEMDKLLIQYQALKSEADSSREVYKQALSKLNLVKLMGNMQDAELMSTIKIIDKPQPPMLVGGGGKLNKIAKAGGMGFILGIAVAFLLEFLDNVVRNPKDIQRFLTLPFLGFVPSLTSAQMHESPKGRRSFVTLLDPSSSEAESLRNVRTNLIFSFADRKNHSILFTSPNPMEGKSTVISQLAASISQLGKKTLLVDTDLRRPTLHKIMHVENRSGVSDILIGEATLEGAIHATDIPNLDFLCAGTIPPNPSELLGSESMRGLIDEMKSRYDLVLFDSPPILPVVDAKVLGSLMDGICIVPRSGQTTLSSLNLAIEQMQERTIRILGVILNHLDMAEFATHYGYTYGYYQSQSGGDKEEEVSVPSAST